MDYLAYSILLFSLLAEVVFCSTKKSEKACYTDLGCFDADNLLGLGYRLPDTAEDVGTQFQLFTQRTAENKPAILDYLDNSTLQAFDNSKNKTLVVVHGMKENASVPDMVMLRTAILKQFDFNVIMVDWRNGAKYMLDYLRSVINVRLVGRQLARLLQLLNVLRGLNVKNVHLIGASLGAHVSGFAGKWYKEIAGNNTIGRITGMDAAGTGYQLEDTQSRLFKTDADFVDAIHSSSGKIPIIGDAGILPPIGHVDFYPNGGRFQPQCPLLKDPSCSHRASVAYFAESISNACPFTSTPCPNVAKQLSTALYWKTSCNKPCENNCGRMGYYSEVAPGRGSQYLETSRTRPYCMG